MAAYTMDQAVHPGDLILAFSRTKPAPAHMLLVKLADSNNPHPSASSIIVDEVNMHIPEEKDAWMMSGPDVYYIPDDEEDEGEGEGEGRSPVSNPLSLQRTLEDFLVLLVSSIPPEDREKNRYRDVGAIVNPHGRDVLKYYFKYACPECGGLTWICPGCMRWPDIGGGCGVDQSCPVCMGYEFALEDNWLLLSVEDLKVSGRDSLSTERRQEIYDEALPLQRERYELINSRRAEMGLQPYGRDQLQRYDKQLKSRIRREDQ